MPEELLNILGGIVGIGLGVLFLRTGIMEKFYRLVDRLFGLDG